MKIADLQLPPLGSTPPPPLPGNETGAAKLPAPSSRDMRSFEERFSLQVQTKPAVTAVADEFHAMSYSELDSLSRSVAGFIHAHIASAATGMHGVANIPVAVMCRRNRLFVAAMLGIIRAGAIYTPIDPSLPLQRRESMLVNSGAPLLITDKTLTGDACRLQYTCPTLTTLLCLDAVNFDDVVEQPGDLMDMNLWHTITEDASDSSWKSYFDGMPLAAGALQSMADNAVSKTSLATHPSPRVLDIGSGAGTVAKTLLSNASLYSAVDISRNELDRLEDLRPEASARITAHQIEAIDIHLLNGKGNNDTGNYDFIFLNSVIENFPGYGYLRATLNSALSVLSDTGTLFIGCVWDLEKYNQLHADLKSYSIEHGNNNGLIRLESTQELFVPKSFFTEWAATCGEEISIECSTPDITLKELSAYRFDVCIRKQPSSALQNTRKETQSSGQRFGTDALQQYASFTPVPVTPDTAAYLIFTSGSTGEPKGVVVEHGSLLNLTDALFETVYAHVPERSGNAEAQTNVALLASFSFDASLQQLFAAPLGGHTLHIVPEETRRNPPALHAFLQERRIDVCDGTPSLFSLLTAHWHDHAQHGQVHTFILGGEALLQEHLQQFFSIAEHKEYRIINAYGPTECCVDATLHAFTSETYTNFAIPPLGKALPHTEISVRNKAGDIMPEGLVGELWIGGAGVARGYWNNPEATSNAFINHEDKRWYKTGDLGQYHKSGVLFFMGRADQQVKIGGHRIELEEVETALNAAPMVKQAAALANDFTNQGVKTIAAYVVPRTTLDSNALRAYLANHLPAYAIPSYFVELTSLPTTSSGKIDKRSLPSPTQSSADSQERIPPETNMEKALAPLWEEVLGHPVNSIHSDFFQLGGHSVLCIKLLALIEKRIGTRLSLSSFFAAPTITKMAALLEKETNQAVTYDPVIQIRSGGDATPMLFFHPVGGSVYCYQPLANQLNDAHPIYAIEAPGYHADTSFGLESIEAMAARYLAAIRKKLPEHNTLILGGWSLGGLVAYEAAKQFNEQGGTVDGIVLLDTVAFSEHAKDIIQGDEASMIHQLLAEIIPYDHDEFVSKPAEERMKLLIEIGQQHGALPHGFSQKQLQRLFQVYQNNALAAARYTAKPFHGKALLVRPQEISFSSYTSYSDPLLGWGNLLKDGVEIVWVGGNHESMLTEKKVSETATHINNYFSRS